MVNGEKFIEVQSVDVAELMARFWLVLFCSQNEVLCVVFREASRRGMLFLSAVIGLVGLVVLNVRCGAAAFAVKEVDGPNMVAAKVRFEINFFIRFNYWFNEMVLLQYCKLCGCGTRNIVIIMMIRNCYYFR